MELMREISEKTKIPLFATLGFIASGISTYGAILIYIGSLNSKIDVTEAKIQADEVSRAQMITSMREMGLDIAEVKKSAAHSEGMLQILVNDRSSHR